MNLSPFPRMHVSLYVRDILQTVNFYTAFFGQPATKLKPGYAKYVLEQPSLIISFVENPERVNAHFGHLGLQVETEEQLMAHLQRVRAAGLPLVEEMGTACCYAIQDKFWVSDPDGAQWEIYLFKEDAEWNDARYSTGESSACCMPGQATAPAQASQLVAEASPVAACSPGGGCC